MTTQLIGIIVKFMVVAALIATVITQCRKPKWFLGRFYVWLMNRSHSGLTTWGLTHVTINRSDTILDVGCGGGRTIQRLAAMASEGKVFGVDYSTQSVLVACKTNRELIASGRVEIQHGSVSSLPFPDREFDLITAVETHYYWPDPVNDLREILRVLKPGGSLVIIAEVYKRREREILLPMVMRLLGGTCPSVREQTELFGAAGYDDVQTFEETRKGWFCGVARRPEVVVMPGESKDGEGLAMPSHLTEPVLRNL